MEQQEAIVHCPCIKLDGAPSMSSTGRNMLVLMLLDHCWEICHAWCQERHLSLVSAGLTDPLRSRETILAAAAPVRSICASN